jgi:uncharacterized protein
MPFPIERKMVCGMSATTAQGQLAARRSDSTHVSALPVKSSRSSTKNPSRSGAVRSISFPGPAGRLEGILNFGSPNARFAALVCHPHPVYGGNLHNKVVYHAMKALNDREFGLGWPVLRFNFRGAGLSEGVHDGQAEVGDVLAALDWLEREFERPIVLAGFSFGAAMALRACSSPGTSNGPEKNSHNVQALIALGLPTQIESPAYRYSFLQNLMIPKLFLSGDRDEFARTEQLEKVFASAAEPKQLILLSGADHFFSGQLEPMQRAIASWVKEQSQ